MHASAIRTRWAAIGAAVAVSLGAGGIGIGHATVTSGDKPVVVTIDPCRLADTRPAPDTVGPRTTGIGPGETYVLDGWGTVGNCTLPAGITGLALNVTAVGATEQTNLRFFPTGGAVPTAANLNPTPGAPPTPNAVTVGLNGSDGQFSVFNKFGVVAVIIDVVGYLDDHIHDDRYYQKSEVDSALAGKADQVVVHTGQISVRYPADTGFAISGDSYVEPLPAGTPEPTLERITPSAWSANCPGYGQAAPGILCLYEFNTSNIATVVIGGINLDALRYGFELDLLPTNPALDGFYLASWAYQAP